MSGETLKGHLDMLLLAAIRVEPAHGYVISERLCARSGGVFDLPEGTIYPALHRLEHDGFLGSRWERGESGRRRRVYEVTPAGEQALQAQLRSWEAFSGGVAGILGTS
jgi:transcriptional regulator